MFRGGWKFILRGLLICHPIVSNRLVQRRASYLGMNVSGGIRQSNVESTLEYSVRGAAESLLGYGSLLWLG